ELRALRAGVADAEARRARQLALVIDGPLLHARRREIRIGETDAAAGSGRETECVADRLREAVRGRVVDGVDDIGGRVRDARRLRVADRVDAPVLARRPEQTVPAAQNVVVVDLEDGACARR